ncbi:MAG: PAS domain S-box protein, partial [Pseudomonadota bacterium]|nr:PAS domain S-box protein [Pseudomonadota bacterium]
PLTGPQGYRYGMLCVIDMKPRVLTDEQRDGLTRLARRASEALETRRLKRRAEDRESTLTQLLEAMPDGVVTCDAEGLLGEFNHTAREWHGVDPRALPPEQWAEHFGLYCADGDALLSTDEVPLLRALQGEHVLEAEIVIRAAGQPARLVRCNGKPVRASDGTLLGAVCVMYDVTRLKAAEETAQLEAQRFADAFTAAAQGMALVSLEGRWLEANDALCEMFGYSREELLATDFQQLTHPDDLKSDLQLVEELLSGRKQRYQMEKRYFHRSGAVIHAHLSVSLVHDAMGRPLHFVSQLQDFTQRYVAERGLRESELKFRSVLEHTHDAFVACDASGVITEWNNAAEVTFGWRRGEVVGRLLDEVIVPPRMRTAHRAGMARFLQTGESRVLDQRLQLPAWHRLGYEFPSELTISMLQIDGKQVFSAFLQDITARVKHNDTLTATATQLRTITDNVPALIAHIGSDLRYRFVNRAYAEFFGRASEDLIGLHLRDVLHAEHYEIIEPTIARVQAGEQVSIEEDVRGLDEGIRHMHATYIPEQRLDAADAANASFHLMARDQTAEVRLARMLLDQVLHDELTGLPNRAAWNGELASAIARAQAAGTPIAVMFLDLDDFKQINDVHGHAAGDHVLRAFAAALRDTLRPEDIIARLAGDEFVVLLDRVADIDADPLKIAEKILERVANGTMFEGHHLSFRPSIGIGIQRAPDYDAVALMRCADEEMYLAKRTVNHPPHVRDCIAQLDIIAALR